MVRRGYLRQRRDYPQCGGTGSLINFDAMPVCLIIIAWSLAAYSVGVFPGSVSLILVSPAVFLDTCSAAPEST